MATEKDVFSIIAADRNSPRSVLAQLISDKYHVEADLDDVQRLKVKFNNRYSRYQKTRNLPSMMWSALVVLTSSSLLHELNNPGD